MQIWTHVPIHPISFEAAEEFSEVMDLRIIASVESVAQKTRRVRIERDIMIDRNVCGSPLLGLRDDPIVEDRQVLVRKHRQKMQFLAKPPPDWHRQIGRFLMAADGLGQQKQKCFFDSPPSLLLFRKCPRQRVLGELVNSRLFAFTRSGNIHDLQSINPHERPQCGGDIVTDCAR
jgi:hypothetical protein